LPVRPCSSRLAAVAKTPAPTTAVNSTDDALMGNTNDVTPVDAMNGTDANLGARPT
jgi:hypothetical protein